MTREEKIAMLTDAEIADKKNELWFNKSQGEDLSGNERVIAILINDLQQTRQDLRKLCEEILGNLEATYQVGAEAKAIKKKYGWEERDE